MLIQLLFCLGVVHAQNLEVITPKGKNTYTLKELKAKLKTVTVKIDDPVFGKQKEFDAFSLPEILQLGGVSMNDKADELVFTALDGYSPNTSFAKLKAHKAYVAYQEHGTKGKFGMVAQGKAMVSPGPFYVIWEEGAKLKSEVPWAYQLAKLEVVDWAAKYPQVIPQNVKDDSPEKQGFAIFKNDCVRCHSINLQGGDLGPELNAPQNVTEYWKPDVLRAFIQNPSAFRYKSKMPPFPNLSKDQLDHLMAYLKHMKNQKIKNP